jgi:ClpP class serine protease
MAAILIHKGSAESRDSDDLIQSALKRIEDQLGTEPTLRTDPLRQDNSLHVLPDSFEGWMLKDGVGSEPEAYYDTQDEAVQAGRQLASRKKVSLVIHSPDGTVRDSVDRD